ncbi:tyrosine-type recombinase/integrase [Microbacterium hydrocarbonoxydans]|uniref:tyrosine-type recombinase/integrase n=1 Tax=Microbacterium hydrocarbonoxydans TaxID=273678 RepID=UPI0020407208|nr:site-specific integrase [Microbacterium hydrocarbonoxydans]MCM3779878.1 site-specific integrase [Microbacterium hydrocarbonoxydans]
MASIKQRADGVWRARYRDQNGKEHAKHAPTKKLAQKWLDEQTAAMVTGQWADPSAGRATWDEWVSRWLAMQVWAGGTVTAATTAVESVPWRQKAIRDVKAGDVQTWVTKEAERGLAASTIRTRLNYVQMAFRAAVDNQVIARSPAVRVKTPRQRKREATMKILTAEQVSAVLEASGDFRPFVEVCVFAGLRLGEAAGLQHGDLHRDVNTISVHRQVQGSSIPTTKITPPKAGSERDVFVPAELIDMLSSTTSGLDQFLFRTPMGHLYNRNSAGERWRSIRRQVGLGDDVTLHTLRHTFASNLIASGCDVVTVQRALGHSQPSITLNVYSHLWPSAEDKTRTATSAFMKQVSAI